MTPLRKLRKLVQSRDIDSCRQGVELAAALGGDEIPQLLARSGVRVAPSSDLLIGRSAKFLKRSLPRRVPQVVPGVGTRGAPAAVRAWVTLALAARSECRSARRLRRTTSLALTGQTDVREHMSIDVSVLERFSELDSLWLLNATQLEGESALSDLPLQRLVLSNVRAFDLSKAVMPDLESLELQCFLPLSADSGLRFVR